jgi:hypothetical protein
VSLREPLRTAATFVCDGQDPFGTPTPHPPLTKTSLFCSRSRRLHHRKTEEGSPGTKFSSSGKLGMYQVMAGIRPTMSRRFCLGRGHRGGSRPILLLD